MNGKMIGAALGILGAAGAGAVVAYQASRPAAVEEETQAAEAETPEIVVPKAPTRERLRDERGSFEGRGGFDRSRWDTDGDGELSQEERRAMIASMRAERMARMDLDGDGEVSDEERRAARREWFKNSRRGRQIASRYDIDGDGELSDSEMAVMEEARRAREQERLDRRIAEFDLDGDGELDDIEESLARDAERAQRQEFMDQLTQRFDSDGDGRLSGDERQDAFSQFRSARERQSFRERYDVAADGSVDNQDFESFLMRYNEGAMSADVNSDGVLDQGDVQAFRDLMIEHEIAGEDELNLDELFGGRGGGFGGFRGGGGGGRGGGGGP